MTHIVQFYDHEEALYSLVSAFLADGLAAGEHVLVVGTEEHRREFAARLRARNIDFEADHLLMVDARQLMSTFMIGAAPDAQRFRDSVVGTIRRHLNGSTKIRIYGEMVDLLWRDGNAEGALQLEDLWNDAETELRFSLLCAYSLAPFFNEMAEGNMNAFE